MNNKKKNILVWIFVWTGLLIAVLYSPIGSPDLYSNKGYFAGNQSVDFAGSAIENAPKGDGFSYQDDDNRIDIPDYSSGETSPGYAVSRHSYSESESGSSGYATQSSSTSQSINTNKSSDNLGSGGSSFISNNSSKGGDASSEVAMNNGGITTLSTDLATTNSSTKQAVLSHSGHGTDPGGNPTGPPIPVGDGWIFLLVLATGYGVWKKKFGIS